MKKLISLFGLVVIFINTSLCQANSDKMTFWDLKFGMSIEEVKNITEKKFKHWFTKHPPSEGIVQCNSSVMKWGESTPRWDYIFIDDKLVRVIIEVKQHPDVVMKKLEDTYGGYAQINYSIANFKTGKKYYIWKGNFKDLDNEIKKMKSVPYLKIQSIYFISECDNYDIKYRRKGIGFVFPGIIQYSIKNCNEKISEAKAKNKKYKDAMKEKQLKEEYDKLKL